MSARGDIYDQLNTLQSCISALPDLLVNDGVIDAGALDKLALLMNNLLDQQNALLEALFKLEFEN